MNQGKNKVMDWLIGRGWIAEWIIIFVGIPVILLLAFGTLASILFVFCRVTGLL